MQLLPTAADVGHIVIPYLVPALGLLLLVGLSWVWDTWNRVR